VPTRYRNNFDDVVKIRINSKTKQELVSYLEASEYESMSHMIRILILEKIKA
jgi:hypothetical protein